MRVFVSGLGMITPLGIDTNASWTKIKNGETNIAAIPEHWNNYIHFNSKYRTVLPKFNFLDHGFKRNELIQKAPCSLTAIMTTNEALTGAGFELELTNKKTNQYEIMNIDPLRASVNFGTGWSGGSSILDNSNHQVLNHLPQKLKNLNANSEQIQEIIDSLLFPKRYNPFVVPQLICNSVPSNIAMKYSIKGHVRPTVQACSSATTAIGRSTHMIRTGEADLVITGGAELFHDEYGCSMYSFDSAKTLVETSEGCDVEKLNRPFDKDRAGFLFSEGGSGTLILESERHLEERGGTPLAEILGHSESFDAYSIMAPDPSGEQIERMMRDALSDASLLPEDIDYINAHGTSTQANDQTEADVLERVFGKHIAINSTKSVLGHTIGASGAIEAIVGILSIRDQELHPSLNLENPIADLDFVTERRKQKVDHVLSHSFAFGGHNSGIILGKV